MLADKMSATRAPGHWFALFGIANLALYGASLFASEASFDYHFGYNGDGRFFQPFRSMIASERLINVACTAPALILGGTYLQSKIGVMASTKFFAMSLLSTYLFTVACGPASPVSNVQMRQLWHKFMPNIGNFNDEKKHMVGADGVAMSVIYMILCYHRMFPIVAGLALADLTYYGAYGLGAPACATFAFLTLL